MEKQKGIMDVYKYITPEINSEVDHIWEDWFPKAKYKTKS